MVVLIKGYLKNLKLQACNRCVYHCTEIILDFRGYALNLGVFVGILGYFNKNKFICGGLNLDNPKIHQISHRLVLMLALRTPNQSKRILMPRQRSARFENWELFRFSSTVHRSTDLQPLA